MNKKIMKLAVVLGLFSLLALPVIASAAEPGAFLKDSLTTFGEATELPTGNLQTVIANILNSVLTLLGVVAVVIILIGGFKWMTAMGNDDAVKKAKSLIIQGVVGLVIVIAAYAIAQFIMDALYKATTAG